MIVDYTPDSVKLFAKTYLFDHKKPSLALCIWVVVPVRNEAHHLVQTLESLRLQQDTFGQPLDPTLYEVLVLVNNCTDASLAVAQCYQKRYPHFSLHLADIQLPVPKANIGTVRRLLMDEAHRRLTNVGNREGIIASTDGDTVVDPQWLWHIMAEIEQGVDAVGGRILTHPDKNPVRFFHLRDVTYRTLVARLEAQLDPVPHDPWPRHFQYFGANLAVTYAMYEKAGRLPEVPYLEDEAFYKALLRVDARVRQSPLVRVITSARMQGRVAVGFSEQLRCWATIHKNGQYQLAEPAGAWADKFAARYQLRTIWANNWADLSEQASTEIATQLYISANWLCEIISDYQCFGELWQIIEQQMIDKGFWVKRWPLMPIGEAIAELRKLGVAATGRRV